MLDVKGKYRDIMDRGVKKKCMAACKDQTFDVALSSNTYPGRQSYNHRPEFCIIVRLGNYRVYQDMSILWHPEIVK